MTDPLSYSAAGVDIDSADATKRRMAASIDRGDVRVLNKFGAFAALVQGTFPAFAEPVLVLKVEEPGSKQKLAFELDRVESLCEDLVNHLVNDVAVMAAHPLYVLDCIVCGRLDAGVVERLVAGMAGGLQSPGRGAGGWRDLDPARCRARRSLRAVGDRRGRCGTERDLRRLAHRAW